MHVFVVFDVLLFDLGMKSLLIAMSWLMCTQWWKGSKGNIFGSIQHQRTELTQLGHI